MQIEKVSRYIDQLSESRSAGINGRTRRRVLLSLPRIQWLERQPDYTPWPPLQEDTPEAPQEPPAKTKFRHWSPSSNDTLTPQQQKIWEMHSSGMSVVEIAERLGKTRNAASKSLQEARLKMGVGLG